MYIIRGLVNFPKHLKSNVALTIGTFDGIHIGHNHLIKNLIMHSKERNLKSILLSFYPSPKKILKKEQILLSDFKQNFSYLKKLGLDYYLLVRFDHQMANVSAEEFIKKILIDTIGIKQIIIGQDFRFGKGRAGNFGLLKEFADKYKFEVKSVPSVNLEGVKISSSQIRDKIKQGNFDSIKKILGREYSIIGKVIHGQKLGTKLGFATANIALKHNKNILRGVFCTEVLVKNKIYPSVTNIGIRPTIDKISNPVIEVHILDFNDTIYGQTIEVYFKSKVRDEQKFKNVDELISQIKKDILYARNFFT